MDGNNGCLERDAIILSKSHFFTTTGVIYSTHKGRLVCFSHILFLNGQALWFERRRVTQDELSLAVSILNTHCCIELRNKTLSCISPSGLWALHWQRVQCQKKKLLNVHTRSQDRAHTIWPWKTAEGAMWKWLTLPQMSTLTWAIALAVYRSWHDGKCACMCMCCGLKTSTWIENVWWYSPSEQKLCEVKKKKCGCQFGWNTWQHRKCFNNLNLDTWTDCCRDLE